MLSEKENTEKSRKCNTGNNKKIRMQNLIDKSNVENEPVQTEQKNESVSRKQRHRTL